MTVAALLAAAPLAAQIAGASRLLSGHDPESQPYRAVARFRPGSTCTGFLVETGGAPQAPAYLISAGHCITTQFANEILLDQPLERGEVLFDFFHDTPPRRIAPRRLAYSTMKGRDLAIVELAATRAELAAAGYTPFALAATAPQPGEPVITISAPSINIPEGEVFLRQARCTLGPQRDIAENIWIWRDAYRNTCSDVLPGASGSPVIAQRTGEVVALMTTTTYGAQHHTGDFRCYFGQPCEIASGYQRDTNYALPLAGIANCFRAGRFDLQAPGCPLDATPQVSIRQNVLYAQPGAPWDATVSGSDYETYRYKIVLEGVGDCRDSQGYGPARPVAAEPGIGDKLPAEPGRYHLCVIGEGQDPRTAAIRIKIADSAPPTIPIPYLWLDDERNWTLQPIFVIPELSGYNIKIALTEDDTCDREQGYRPFLRVPVRIEKASRPVRACVVGMDFANNATPPLEFRLDGARLFPGGAVNAVSFRRPVAPGGALALFGANLTMDPARLRDAAGTIHSLPLLFHSPGQVNIGLPDSLPPGPARIDAAGVSADIAVYLLAPAIGAGLTAFRRTGQTEYRAEPATISPGLAPLAEGEEVLLRIPATGLSRLASPAQVRVELGGLPLEVVTINGSGPLYVVARIPPQFPLRGYLPLLLTAGGNSSNQVFLRLRALAQTPASQSAFIPFIGGQ